MALWLIYDIETGAQLGDPIDAAASPEVDEGQAAERCVADFPGALEWSPADRAFVEPDFLLNRLRRLRDKLIASTDWWMLTDVVSATSAEIHEARLAYRQALRDWPATETNLEDAEPPPRPA